MKHILVLFFIISARCYGQFNNVNSGAQAIDNFSFTIGEIFVVEIEKENKNFLDVTLYPNPVSNIAFLEIKGVLKNKRIQVFSIAGELIYSGELIDSNINFADISQGIYFIKSESNEFEPIKIIKN